MKKLLFFIMLFLFGGVLAQGSHTMPVKVSDQKQTMNGKEYYIHIVEQGQTVFSIARAYGLKYYDAVIKTDIHNLKVGDTVWLPTTEYSVAAVAAAAQAIMDVTANPHYIKIESGQTLYGLSRSYGVTVEEIIEANPELKTEPLKAGQMLKIPPRSQHPKEAGAGEGPSEATPAAKPAAQPATQPVTNTAAKPAEQPAAKPATQPVANTAAKPAEQPAAKPATQPVSNTVVKTAEQPAPKPAAKPAEQTQTSQSAGGEAPAVAGSTPRPVQNPYPFAEVPDNFPKQQAAYYDFITPSEFNFQVRDRQSKDKIYITVMMPLHLDKINEISTSKFDIEQRGKKEYKVFEFIQFYEGILMALDELQAKGYQVVLNVVDMTSEADEDVEAAFRDHNVANSDFIIALLVKKPFQKVAELALLHQVFVINPFSSRDEILKNNPYVIKYMPSVEGTVKGMLDVVARQHKDAHVLLVHSNNKSANSDEKIYLAEFQKQLGERKDMPYSILDWAANSKLITTLKQHEKNVIISIYNQDKNRNTVYVTTLLNRLSTLTPNAPTLMSNSNYLNDFQNIDYEQLQHLDYTMVTMGYLDYNNPIHKQFIDTYKDKFRTEPNTLYAGVAHDITLYFVSALVQWGGEFWRNPQNYKAPANMLFPISLKQTGSNNGYENQSADIYKMVNYKLTNCR